MSFHEEHFMLRYVWTPILLALLVPAPSTATEIRDNFSDAQFAGRVADRGAWKFENQVATCVADLKLYKQYKNCLLYTSPSPRDRG